jgi:hypothetical protein
MLVIKSFGGQDVRKWTLTDQNLPIPDWSPITGVSEILADGEERDYIVEHFSVSTVTPCPDQCKWFDSEARFIVANIYLSVQKWRLEVEQLGQSTASGETEMSPP